MNTAATSSSVLSWSMGRKAFLVGAVALGALLASTSCTTTIENRDPLGEPFPEVVGEALDGETLSLPLDEPSVLLIGYVQDAQFDADRWLVGLLQAPPPVRILEVPTVVGLFPRLIADTIDSGMRSGIPSEDWQSVVTLYGSKADQVLELTGNERPRNIRVLLLDAEGRVRWFHDRGFSASKLLELGDAARLLGEASSD
ncbi:MAG: hypothetical protein ACI8QZ_001237 [Chlamydiales bacterium]|jgi:hypothetical protein